MMALRRQMMGVIAGMAGGLPTGIKAFKMGTTTINAAASVIEVQTNLGYKPDLAALWVDDDDASLIPNGSCVKVVYQRQNYTNSNQPDHFYAMWYMYKHGTSGNLLIGQYNPGSDTAGSENLFKFTRGSDDWKATDTNGNPIVYRWAVIAFDY